MASTSRSGVDRALPKVSRPDLSSNTAISVKVPPMSAARRRFVPFLAARDLGGLVMIGCDILMSGHGQRVKGSRSVLFDDLVCAAKQVRRDLDAERPGGFQIDHQLELDGLPPRQGGG